MFAVVFAAKGSTPYNVMLLLHLLGAIVAFGAAFVNPIVYRFGQKAGAGAAVAEGQAAAGLRISLPAMLLTGLFGFGMVGMSDKTYTMSQSWVMAAILIWLIMAALYFFGILPAQRKLADGDEAAVKIVGALGGVSHVLLLVMLYLMIWKPGL